MSKHDHHRSNSIPLAELAHDAMTAVIGGQSAVTFQFPGGEEVQCRPLPDGSQCQLTKDPQRGTLRQPSTAGRNALRDAGLMYHGGKDPFGRQHLGYIGSFRPPEDR